MRGAMLLFAASLFLPGTARAAQRTVSFNGMIGAEFTTGDVSNRNNVAHCTVTLVNTGSTDQKITSVQFLDYMGNTQKTSGAAWASPDIELLRSSSSAGTCLGQTLAEGSVCLFRFATQPVSAEGRYLVCAGRITVEDVQPNAPGAIIASGVATMIQEQKVLGGILSGAYYASGAHTWAPPTPNVRYAPGYPGGSTQTSHNMNFYCASACIDKGGAPSFCQAHCGHVNDTTDVGSVTHSAIMWDTENSAYTSVTSTPYNLVHPNYNIPATSLSAASCSNGGLELPVTSTPTAGFSRNPYPSVLRTSNDHYAWGMVYELSIGPLTSICSGLLAFEEQGGENFTHADSVDPFVTVEGTTAGGPPENLVCSHRHAQDDLYLGLGSSNSFAINSGNPF